MNTLLKTFQIYLLDNSNLQYEKQFFWLNMLDQTFEIMPDTRIIYFSSFHIITILEILQTVWFKFAKKKKKKVLIQIFSLLEPLTYFSSLSIDL